MTLQAPPSSTENNLDLPMLVRTFERLIDAWQQHMLDAPALAQSMFDIFRQTLGGTGGCILLGTAQLELTHHLNLPAPLVAYLQTTLPTQIANPIAFARDAFARFDLSCIAMPLTAHNQVLGVFALTPAPSSEPPWLASQGERAGLALEQAWEHYALEQKYTWVSSFIEHTPDPIFESDLQGRICFVNQAICDLLGFSRQEMLTQSVTDFQADAVEYVNQVRQTLRETGVVINVLAHLTAKDNSIKTVRFTSRMVADQQGKPLRFQTIMRDVTDQEHIVTALDQRNRELNALNNIATILGRPFELERTLTEVCKQIATIIGMETIAIYQIDSTGEFLNLVAHYGIVPDLLDQVKRLGLDDPITQYLIVENKPFAINDVMSYQGDSFAGPRAFGYHAGIGVPIRQRGKPVGTIHVGSQIVRSYQPSDVELLLNIGNQIGNALENAELYLQKEKRLHELDGLAQLSAKLVSALDVQTIANHTIDCLRGLFDADASSVRFSEQDKLRLYSAFTHTSGLSLSEEIPLEAEVQLTLTHHQNFVVDDTRDQTRLSPASREHLESRGLRAVVMVPFFAHNQLAGSLSLMHTKPHHWQSKEIDLIQTIANQIGLAVEKADLYQQSQARLRELEGLAELSFACTNHLALPPILDSTIQWTKTLLNADIVDVRSIQGKHIEAFANYVLPHKFNLPDSVAMNDLWPLYFEKRMPFFLNNVPENTHIPPRARQLLQSHGIAAVLAVPLVAQDQVTGVLSIVQHAPRQWSQHEIDLLRTIANQTANAIYNAQLFQDLLNEQSQTKAIFDSGLNGLYVTDLNGRITMFNDAAVQMTGWQREEAVGSQWETIFADADGTPRESLVGQVINARQKMYPPAGREIQQRNGIRIPILEAAAPLFDDKNNVRAVVGAFWDLTTEKQAEIERTKFVQIFAHQLGTPLTTLVNAAEMLARRKLKPAQRTMLLGILKNEGERMQKFARQFLQMKGAFAVPAPIKFQAFDLEPLIRAAIARYTGDSHQHRFRCKISRPLPLTYADPERVEHILANLLDNAVNYSAPKTLITVEARAINDQVQVTVTDQGVGIPLAEQELIFERFYRVKHSASGRVHGHGLGLAIVREMVTEMQGMVWVESQPGQGTTFRFTLRRAA